MGTLAIAVEILAERAEIEEKDGHVKPRLVLFGQDGFLGGGHAADRRAIFVVAARIARADALDKGHSLGRFAVGGAKDVAAGRAGGRKQSLELHVGKHVGGEAESEFPATRGVEGLETGRQHDAADIEFHCFFRLIVVDCPGLADLGTQPTLAGAEMDATIAVDHRHAGRRLRMGQIDAGPGGKVLIEARKMRFGSPRCDRIQIDGPRRAHENACPAGLALIGRFVKGRANLARCPAPEQIDRSPAHHLVAYPRAKSAENAIALGGRLKWSGFDAQIGRKFG